MSAAVLAAREDWPRLEAIAADKERITADVSDVVAIRRRVRATWAR